MTTKTNSIKPGVYTDMTIEEYHGDTDYLSNTGFQHFLKSPRHYLNWKLDPEERKTHFDFGNAFEIYLVDRDRFADEVFVWDEDAIILPLIADGAKSPRATKIYKEAKSRALEECGDRYFITETGDESLDTIQVMTQRAMESPVVSALISNAHFQHSTFWEEDGVKLKSRPDIAFVNKRVVLDIKTSRDASPQGFRRAFTSNGYGFQMGMQIRGVKKTALMEDVDLYYYLVCEKVEPYNCELYRVSTDDMDQSQIVVEHNIEMFRRWQNGDIKFNGYNYKSNSKHGILELDIPPFYWNNY